MELRIERVVVIDGSRHGVADLHKVASLCHPVLHPSRASPWFEVSGAQHVAKKKVERHDDEMLTKLRLAFP